MLSKTSVTGIVCLAFGLGAVGCVDDPPADGVAEVAAEARAVDDYAATRYPIVLLPGIFGFQSMLGVVDYFPGIPEALAAGGAKVFVVVGSGLESSEVRAAQIIPQLEDIQAITGASRLNLVGHSQGAVDARIIAAVRPDLVASVTSVGGPHAGAPLADRLIEPGLFGTVPVDLVGGLGDLMTLLSGSHWPNDAHAALVGLSTAGAAATAAAYPAALPATKCGAGEPVVNGIRYYSWGGVGGLTNALDLLDPLWLLNGIFNLTSSDGMVPQCGTHLGEVIRDDYWQNHIDETNMIFGLVLPLGPRPEELYRAQANRLKLAGL
jgi:triacylglycerol lipase